MGHIHLGHTPKWENWGTARNNWIKAGPNPIRATRNPILSCWVSGVPKGLGSPTPTSSIASLLRQLHSTSFHQKCFMVLLSSTSWVLHCSLGFTFTPVPSSLSGTPPMPTLPSVALWNQSTRLHGFFCLSFLMPAKPIPCGQYCRLMMGLASFNLSCSGYCVPTLGNTL